MSRSGEGSVLVREVGDLEEFAALVRGPLQREEPGNALPLGLLGQIAEGVYDEVTLAVVEAAGEPVGCVIRTDPWPYNVTAFSTGDAGAVGEVVGRWLAGRWRDGLRLVGPRIVSDPAARSVAAAVGGEAEVVLPLRRMVCHAVTWRPDPPGEPGHAGPDDVDALVDWLERFHEEATPHAPRGDPDALRRRLGARFEAGGPPPLWWWIVDDRPVSLVGIGSPTGSGERIAPVYTPPEHRGRGYAGALVAHVTEDAFARGCRWVGLFTDASNPISNRLYAKLGYVDIGDAAEWRVAGGAAAG